MNLSGAGMARNVLYGVDEVSVGNRWMDKWVILVTADGQVGRRFTCRFRIDGRCRAREDIGQC
jgi:hypothetical protein